MGSSLLNGIEDYKLIPQEGVRQYTFPPHHSHNAIWDSNVGPDGRFYFGLASEISTHGYVRLCVYDYHTDSVEELFRAEDVIMPQDRAIRASKFHSSICPMPDGRLIMTTHTTDRSPNHPTWMPVAYYHHLWESFAGSNIIIYDPKTKKPENIGIPVRHESIYGSRYDAAHNALFCSGIFRGHLYRVSLDDRSVIDLGKMSENFSFRLVIGSDGNLYGASRSGYLYKVDTETLKITDLGYQFQHTVTRYPSRYNNLSIARTGPDGRLYLAGMYSPYLLALDPPTGKIENMGKYIPTEKFNAEENRNVIFGMDFDTKGVLWYCVSAINDGGEHHEFGLPAGLFRWDVARGGKPEYMGIAGVPERAACTVSEVSVNKEDILYISSTNHMLDGPQVIGVDLKVFDTSKPETGGMVKDPYFLKNDPGYAKDRQQIKYYEDQAAANPTDVSYEPACLPALLWRALAPDHIEDSCVKALFWDGADLCGICGEKDTYAFRIRDGEIVMLKPLSELAGAEKYFFLAGSARPAFSKDSFPPLPFVPGRQYKAVASAAADLPGGRKLIGTEDGLLAILENGKVKGLGAPSANGPIHALSAVPGKARVYGVSGDPEDIPTLFMWDDETGLTSLGCMAHGQGDDIRKVFNLTCVTSLAVSPDGKYLAVGADERLGTVVIYRLP